MSLDTVCLALGLSVTLTKFLLVPIFSLEDTLVRAHSLHNSPL